MRSHSFLQLALATAVIGLAAGGCRQMMVDRQVQSVRTAAPAFQTVGDFEVARVMAYSSLGNYEGQHRLAPNNADALFLLTRGWASAGFSFIEDDWESALDAGDDEAAEENRTRARGAYARAVFYGLELLELKVQDFQLAHVNPAKLKAWLGNFGPGDVDSLYWTGFAWLAHVGVSRDIPAITAEAGIGVALLERVIELDETFAHGMAHTALGAWYGRAAGSELDKSRRHFERALQLNGRRMLMTQFQFARTYYCSKQDKDGYVRLLTEVVNAGDPMPEHRLSNVVAQRRAKRYLSEVRLADCGF